MSLADALFLDPYPFNIWVASRTDGVKGSGTLSDPYNGSTADSLDAILRSLSENTRIHLASGTFETRGYYDGTSASYGWQPKRGQKIVGAGIDATVLRLVEANAANAQFFAIGHALNDGGTPPQPNLLDFFEVSDLTIDCNLTAQPGSTVACGAVRLMGNNARVRCVKVKNWGTKTANVPCTVIAIITADPVSNAYETRDSGIEECLAIEPAASAVGAKVTALHAGSASDAPQLAEAYGRGPFIRNCFIDCGTVPGYRGLSMNWCRAGIVEGNQVHNTTYGGPYLENQGARDIIIRNNFYRNVIKGPFLNMGRLEPSTRADLSSLTRISTSPPTMEATTDGSHPLVSGDRVKIQATPSEFSGVFVVKAVIPPNKFQYLMTATPQGTITEKKWQKVFSVGRLIIEGNVIEMPADTMAELGIHLHDDGLSGQDPDHALGDVIIRGNKIRYLDGLAEEDSTGSGIVVNGAKNLLLRENLVEVLSANPICHQRCRSAHYFNNRTTDGVLLAEYDDSTDHWVEELDAQAEDALVQCLFRR